jgi:hypothetical protein
VGPADDFPSDSGGAGADQNDIFSPVFQIAQFAHEDIDLVVIEPVCFAVQKGGGTDLDDDPFAVSQVLSVRHIGVRNRTCAVLIRLSCLIGKSTHFSVIHF